MKPHIHDYFVQLLEAEGPGPKKLVTVYGGRFQPFHKGHHQAYKWLCHRFGRANVWIATSSKTNFDPKKGDISPFNFKEKKEIITQLYPDIPPRRVVECENPAFKPTDVFDLYKGYRPVYLAAVGRKDQERYVGDFFHPIPTDLELPDQVEELLALDENAGYYVEVPMRSQGISGTLVRQDLLAAADDPKTRKKLFEQYFGTYDKLIDSMMVARLKEIK